MQPVHDPSTHVRVLNLSDLTLPLDHVLAPPPDRLEAAVHYLRRYADLPFVYVVAPQQAHRVPPLLEELRAIRSRCYPYAVFALDGAAGPENPDLEVVRCGSSPDAAAIRNRIRAYAEDRFRFDPLKLRLDNPHPLPRQVDVAVIGGGITGIYAANRLREAGLSFCLLEQRDRVGGIWSQFANRASQVNTSECAYRLVEKTARANRDHSFAREILEDIVRLAAQVTDRLYLHTRVEKIARQADGYRIALTRGGEPQVVASRGVILAINDRVGAPREVRWPNRSAFAGVIASGIADGTLGLDWRGKNVVIVGMGAFAVESARTALEGGARRVTVVCRRHGTVCPKIIDYLNFTTPYDEAFKHDKKSNMRNMMYWKKLYDLSGATQPECWMNQIKHDGHTISVSDIWFIAHFLKKMETVTGTITGMTAGGVVVDGRREIPADILVNCIGFERNAPAAQSLSGYAETTNTNYLDTDFMYLADAHIDGEAFNSLFGSSVLEMVKFYMEVYLLLFGRPAEDNLRRIPGVETLPIPKRMWSHYIAGAMALIRHDPRIRDLARQQVARRTANFLEAHDLETYIAENQREWIDTHALLAGRPLPEAECLPYVFEKIAPRS